MIIFDNNIEQTANTYELNAGNKAFIKTRQPNFSNYDWLDENTF
jgi:hypothetical protein